MSTALRSVLAAAIWIASTSAALANFVTFQVQWSGATFNNTAKATGFITFDDAVLPQVGQQTSIDLPNPAVADLGITITGATSGNGTFGLSDFTGVYFATPSALDLSTELIGQPLENNCTFGSIVDPCGEGDSGDFNLISSSGPNGINFFLLAAPESELMLVTSMIPIPEPGTLALLGLGFAGLAASRRRKQ